MSRGRTLARGLAAAAAGYVVAGRGWQFHWGATQAEIEVRLAGDELLPRPDLMTTRSMSIAAPAESVWPWLAQMGQGRGGLYSYDALENMAGCDIHSADHVVPEWQDIKVGDEVRLAPAVPLLVALVEPGKALVVRGGVPMGDTAPPYDFTWAFVLRPDGSGGTRLVVRERYAYTQWWAPLLVEPVEIVDFFMTRKMLFGIKARAEAL